MQGSWKLVMSRCCSIVLLQILVQAESLFQWSSKHPHVLGEGVISRIPVQHPAGRLLQPLLAQFLETRPLLRHWVPTGITSNQFSFGVINSELATGTTGMYPLTFNAYRVKKWEDCSFNVASYSPKMCIWLG